MLIKRVHIVTAAVIIGAFLALMALDRFIVTEKERINQTLEKIAAAFGQKDMDAIFSCFSADYSNDEVNLSALRTMASEFTERDMFRVIRIGNKRINRSRQMAVVMVIVTAEEGRDTWRRRVSSEWQVTMIREADGIWRITRVIPMRVGSRVISGWGEIIGRQGGYF